MLCFLYLMVCLSVFVPGQDMSGTMPCVQILTCVSWKESGCQMSQLCLLNREEGRAPRTWLTGMMSASSNHLCPAFVTHSERVMRCSQSCLMHLTGRSHQKRLELPFIFNVSWRRWAAGVVSFLTFESWERLNFMQMSSDATQPIWIPKAEKGQSESKNHGGDTYYCKNQCIHGLLNMPAIWKPRPLWSLWLLWPLQLLWPLRQQRRRVVSALSDHGCFVMPHVMCSYDKTRGLLSRGSASTIITDYLEKPWSSNLSLGIFWYRVSAAAMGTT